MRNFCTLFCTLFAVCIAVGSCHPGPGGMPQTTPTKKSQAQKTEPSPAQFTLPTKSSHAVEFVQNESESGLVLQISPATVNNKLRSQPVADGPFLSSTELKTLFKRVSSSITKKTKSSKAFALANKSTPPPAKGIVHKSILGKPTATKSFNDASAPLEVLSFNPVGKVSIAPELNVTFSAPMVEVSDVSVNQHIPLLLSPLPKGNWQWLGTQTLQFRPSSRFPMATKFDVRIPKGTQSALGKKFSKEIRYSFETPPAQMTSHWPAGGPHNLEVPIFVEFDQKINNNDMLRYIEVTAKGKKIPVRLATASEIATFKAKGIGIHGVNADQRIVLVPASLPKATTIQVKVKPGAPSAEGPKKTATAQEFEFYTYQPLKLTSARCSWSKTCHLSHPFTLEFNNSVDMEAFDESRIQVSPTISNFSVETSGNQISIHGIKQGNTTYKVRIKKGIKDIYGQVLKKDLVKKFITAPREATLIGPTDDIVSLNPFGPKQIHFHAINHPRIKIAIHRVDETHLMKWANWRRLQQSAQRARNGGPMPGDAVFTKTVNSASNEKWQSHAIDLEKHLQEGVGHFAISVIPAAQPKESWRRQGIYIWVQVTSLGLSAYKDRDSLFSWVTTLKEGNPVSGATITPWPQAPLKQPSDNSGLNEIPLSKTDSIPFLVAGKGRDKVILPATPLYSLGDNSGWTHQAYDNRLSCYMFNDRGTYKPGETVRVKGWLRQINGKAADTIDASSRPVEKIQWVIRDARRNEIANGETQTTSLGGFFIKSKIPKSVQLGNATVELKPIGEELNFPYHQKVHSFQIQEFKKPEFEVNAHVNDGPHILGEHTIATLTASYYTGEALTEAPVMWNISTSPSKYTPPGYSSYSFGDYNPWWRFWHRKTHYSTPKSIQGKTDAKGEHRLDMHFASLVSMKPTQVHINGSVTDVNRQRWNTNTTLLVHPAARYIGLKLNKNFVQKNESVSLRSVVTDIEGHMALGAQVEIQVLHVNEKYVKGQYTETETEVHQCHYTSGKQPNKCQFEAKHIGTYKIIAQTKDPDNRPTRSTMHMWVVGDAPANTAKLEKDKVIIIPQKDKFVPGDKAELLIQAPFYPADGFVTLQKAGIRHRQPIHLDSSSMVIRVPLTDAEIPKVKVQVDLNGKKTTASSDSSDAIDSKPAFAGGSIELVVSPYQKRLNVAVMPNKAVLSPADKTTILVQVSDSNGRPIANAEVALWVVDEAILALSNYRIQDPVELFYAPARPGVNEFHTRDKLLLTTTLPGENDLGAMELTAQTSMPYNMESRTKALPSALSADMSMDTGLIRMSKESAGGGGNTAQPIMVRSNFQSLAYYSPALRTNKNGEVSISFKLPDSLTRYRIMAVAADKKNRFGNGESSMVARLPLMLRPSAPRFLNFGDKFELPIVVHNRTNTTQEVRVAVLGRNLSFAQSVTRLTPGTKGDDSIGKKITVAANSRVEVRFPTTPQNVGTGHLQVIAASTKYGDSATVDVPIWTPATTEAFATYGNTANSNVTQPVTAPKNVWPQFGGLQVSTSSTGLHALTDAFIYLVNYPYQCSEQIASKLLAIVTLKDVLEAFKDPQLPTAQQLRRVVKESVSVLKARQNWNGQFGLWTAGGQSWPFANVHIINALITAKQKGYDVDAQVLAHSKKYLRSIEQYLAHWYSQKSRASIQAYALYVLHKMGDDTTLKAQALLDEHGLKTLSFEAKGWLVQCLSSSKSAKEILLKDAANHVTQTARDAHFVTGYKDGQYVLMHSERRVDGIWLEALLKEDVSNPLIPKIVSGLLGHRKKGRWSSTQENTFILGALDLYFHVYEKVTPDFVNRIWLGNKVSDEYAFKGRTTDKWQVEVPMAQLSSNKENLVIERDGKGRMYYRIAMTYAPKNLNLDAANFGFEVQRTYQAIDDPADVRRDKQGTWHIRAGARVQVQLTMIAPARRYHVALEDRLPAGLEPINPALSVDQGVPQSDGTGFQKKTYWWWSRPWFEHQNLRDERVEAFTSLLWDGVYTYNYTAKATTPGEFVVPPAKASQMYAPETFGRSATDRVIIK